jgi:hypothetical protein
VNDTSALRAPLRGWNAAASQIAELLALVARALACAAIDALGADAPAAPRPRHVACWNSFGETLRDLASAARLFGSAAPAPDGASAGSASCSESAP